MVKLINKIILIIAFSFIITNNVNCQDKIDSLVYFSIESNIDSIKKVRKLLLDELRSQNKNIQLVASLQDYLNNTIDGKLSNQENFLLYIYTEKWDSVLSTISKMEYPYKIDRFSLQGEDVWIWGEHASNCTILIYLIKKSKFINNQAYINISNAALSEEQKDFLKIFLPNYFGYNFTQNNIKVKIAYKYFNKKYPESWYLKYISPAINVEKTKNKVRIFGKNKQFIKIKH